MDAEQYYQSLIAQNYTEQQAEQYTKEYFPDFIVNTPAPSSPLPLPTPLPMPGTDNTTQPTIIHVKSKANIPKAMRIIAAAIGILMAFAILVWTLGIVAPITADNIGDYSDEGTTSADKLVDSLKNIQIITYFSVGLLIGAMVLSVLTAINKSKWWWLPAIIILLLISFIATAYYTTNSANEYYSDCDSEIYYNCDEQTDESMFQQDAMISGYCNGIGVVLIGIMSLIYRTEKVPEKQYSKDGATADPVR